jgi:hypothetical protein
MRSPAGRGRACRPPTCTLRHRPNHRGLTLGSVTHTFQAATTADAQFVHDEWDRRTRAHDIDGLIDLYLADATLEKPSCAARAGSAQRCPEWEQVDLVEVMELAGPRIARHRIYWGWYGTPLLQRAPDADAN